MGAVLLSLDNYNMVLPSIILSTLFLISSVILLVTGYRYRKKQSKILLELSREAKVILDTMSDTDEMSGPINQAKDNISNADYLTTLCTVLVKQAGGEVRLFEEDFNSISEGEYVSVYVDTKDNSLLLRLNTVFQYFNNDDSSTFH